MAKKFLVNNKVVTLAEWKKAFDKSPNAIIVLRTDKLPEVYTPPKVDSVISPEQAKKIRECHKNFNI